MPIGSPRHRAARIAATVLAILVAVVSLAGCGRGDGQTPATGPSSADPALDDGAVHTEAGAVRGQIAPGYLVFQGIPYAAPPVGPLRWQPPQPVTPWQGMRDASRPGPRCVQDTARDPGTGRRDSEDCLSLNVWSPAGATRRPVMVWIHGGAFIQGTAGSSFYDGTHFAERGVVLVSVNYRLGRLGFFGHPALSAEGAGGPPGSYGLMDNVAALKWVKANIAQFGGDPANVTVFGESAGGILVNYLMAAPSANGLFAKAISESGFGRSNGMPIRGDAPRAAEKQGLTYAASVGVNAT